MAEKSSFWTQADALSRKNLTYQKRHGWENCRLITYPVMLCLLLGLTQGFVDKLVNERAKTSTENCGCSCLETGVGECIKKVCGLRFSNLDTANRCPIPRPEQWPPLLHVSNTFTLEYGEPLHTANVLITGNNRSLGENLGRNMLTSSSAINSSNVMESLASLVLLQVAKLSGQADLFLDNAFKDKDLYYARFDCKSAPNLSFSIPDQKGIENEATCIPAQNLWRSSSSQINEEILKDSQFLAAYDFLNSNERNFNVNIWYNPADKFRIARSVNLVSDAFLQYLRGFDTKILFEFIKEMPRVERKSFVDVTSTLGAIFFTWVILRLFLVVFISLVYEKQQKVRIMMKMHGLGDAAYWTISYAYFLVLSLLYMIVFVGFGSVIGLKVFSVNDYSVQFVFYFLYINLQISWGFLLAPLFSYVKAATAVGYLCLYGTGLVAVSLFKTFLEQPSFPRSVIIMLEIYPGFSLYRGLYDLSQYAVRGTELETGGMQWGNLSDEENGMKEVLIIMFIEWLVVLILGYYLDQVLVCGKSPLFFMPNYGKMPQSSDGILNLQREGSKVSIKMDNPDINREREKVEILLQEPTTTHSVICDNLKKVYPGRDGNPNKVAVRGLSLALPPGECFGMLGPNGAGKTSFISMMVGLTKQTSGTAYIEGFDLRTQMDNIYAKIGVCPQHDLLWDILTGREHLLFYGRLKNLKGEALNREVEKSLKSVKLFDNGIADKQAGKYSGGMKRRLSVAISLIGGTKVVYMDEPSTGLDPAARRTLWNVVKSAKQGRVIILTTHSMEEAEALCDRLGVFVDGSFRCIGNAKELKARYGGSFLLTVTTSPDHELQLANLVKQLFPKAEITYHISGTQKFQIPKHDDVRISKVIYAVEHAKTMFPIFAWGLSDSTLEDVFMKVAGDA